MAACVICVHLVFDPWIIQGELMVKVKADIPEQTYAASVSISIPLPKSVIACSLDLFPPVPLQVSFCRTGLLSGFLAHAVCRCSFV